MRDEFYADGKDVWKWTCALEAAEGKTHILHVAMYRPDKRRSYGKAFCNLSKIGHQVVDFFDRERQSLRPTELLQRAERLDLRIEVLTTEYLHKARHTYFGTVVEKLKGREAGSSYVVLLDPDTGIEPARPADEHLCCDDIRSVWYAMSPSDVLLVVQFCRFKNHVESCQRRLQSALQTPVSSLTHDAVRNVRLFRADK